ncbi:hypothetical protein PGT21_009734 [Puccinia graminis f. sp. tritici]|uniref:SBDS family rRNA metabolism protein n=2 Tax=Puccinia graminis f. sp. tritici TaxID=56615 RepID=A0A5B0RGA3_PUCGR|nr:hypothetical protein PGT21_009734 [Puccinia graminis f. sp. tritici]KAA1124886.1 hypothetical protein PGTUg99_036422 [Puccinia graminis f. sp. tritici]
MPVFQPSNQIKLTNVSIVRLKKAGKRFEIACYKNKVMEWRSGVETDLSEVIQTDTIFSNVSKGQLASHSDLLKSFPVPNKTPATVLPSEEILLEILKNGELQVSDKERAQALVDKKREIIHLVAEKTVDPTTNRPHTSSMIEKALDELHFSVNLSKSSKTQALELIKSLSSRPEIISISRSQMKIRLTIPTTKESKKLKPIILESITKVEVDETDEDQWELIALIEPGQFKFISDTLNQFHLKNAGNNTSRFKLETLSLTAEQVEGDEVL